MERDLLQFSLLEEGHSPKSLQALKREVFTRVVKAIGVYETAAQTLQVSPSTLNRNGVTRASATNACLSVPTTEANGIAENIISLIETREDDTDSRLKSWAEVEAEIIERVLAIQNGNYPASARVLNVSPSTLYRKNPITTKA